MKGFARSTKRDAELAAAYCALQAPAFSQLTPTEPVDNSPKGVLLSDQSPATVLDIPSHVKVGKDSLDEDVRLVADESSPEQLKTTASKKINLRSFLASQIKGTPEDSAPFLINKVSEAKEGPSSPAIEEIIIKMPSILWNGE